MIKYGRIKTITKHIYKMATTAEKTSGFLHITGFAALGVFLEQITINLPEWILIVSASFLLGSVLQWVGALFNSGNWYQPTFSIGGVIAFLLQGLVFSLGAALIYQDPTSIYAFASVGVMVGQFIASALGFVSPFESAVFGLFEKIPSPSGNIFKKFFLGLWWLIKQPFLGIWWVLKALWQGPIGRVVIVILVVAGLAITIMVVVESFNQLTQ